MLKMAKMWYDKKNNVVVIQGQTAKVKVTPRALRETLPAPMDEEDQIAELKQIIHEIRKEKLLQVAEYIEELKRLKAGAAGARGKLLAAGSKLEIMKFTSVCRSWLDEKNILREMRYILGKLNDEEKAIRTRIAKLETGA